MLIVNEEKEKKDWYLRNIFQRLILPITDRIYQEMIYFVDTSPLSEKEKNALRDRIANKLRISYHINARNIRKQKENKNV